VKLRGALTVAAATISLSVYAQDLGFPSDRACSFLASLGMVPNKSGYTPFTSEATDDFSCGTPYRDIGTASAGLPNNISYYVRGTRTSAKRLRVLVNVNQPTQLEAVKSSLVQAGSQLFKSAFASDLPADIRKALSQGKPGKWAYKGYTIELLKETWPTGRGLEFNLVVRVPTFSKGM
jgi:hypothetical protein